MKHFPFPWPVILNPLLLRSYHTVFPLTLLHYILLGRKLVDPEHNRLMPSDCESCKYITHWFDIILGMYDKCSSVMLIMNMCCIFNSYFFSSKTLFHNNEFGFFFAILST